MVCDCGTSWIFLLLFIAFYYDNIVLEIVNRFSYLRVVFSTVWSFTECQSTLAGQAQTAIFKLDTNPFKFII